MLSIRLNWLFAVCFCACLTACQTKPDPVAPLNEQPRILTMSIPGIPPSNISINEANHLITVLLPPSLPALDLIPSFTVSEQAKMGGEWGAGKAISFKGYCACTNGLNPTTLDDIKTVRVDNLAHTSYYTIKLKQQGTLTLTPTSTPIVYDNQVSPRQLSLPVQNYYGSSPVRGVAITKAGSASLNWVLTGDGYCFDVCAGRLNEVGITLHGYDPAGHNSLYPLQPGLHDLDLVLYDGTRIHASGAVLVK